MAAKKFDELVAKYIELRDRKAQHKAEYEAKVVKIDEALETIEAIILKRFSESGTESVRTAVGTAYKSVRVGATVADRQIYLDWVLQDPEERSVFLESRVSKKAVEDYMSANEVAPPGVSVRTDVVINVRRS